MTLTFFYNLHHNDVFVHYILNNYEGHHSKSNNNQVTKVEFMNSCLNHRPKLESYDV